MKNYLQMCLLVTLVLGAGITLKDASHPATIGGQVVAGR
jgi:hypothetical protein